MRVEKDEPQRIIESAEAEERQRQREQQQMHLIQQQEATSNQKHALLLGDVDSDLHVTEQQVDVRRHLPLFTLALQLQNLREHNAALQEDLATDQGVENEAHEQGEVGQILLRQIHLEQEQLHLIQQHCSNSCKIYAY